MSTPASGTATVLNTPFQRKYQGNERNINEALVRNSHTMCGVKYGELPVAQLVVDESYQRQLRGRAVNAIASNWDIFKCKAIIVSYRDGTFYVVDGQHRMMAAKLIGEEFLPCQIYMNLNQKQEALLFADQDKDITRPSTSEKFIAGNVGERPDSIAVKEICDRYSIITDKPTYGATGTLRGLSTVQRIYRGCGKSALIWIFDIIKNSGWHNAKGGYSDALIATLKNLYINHNDEVAVTSKALVNQFKNTTPDMIFAQSRIAFLGRGQISSLTAYLEYLISDTKSEVEHPYGIVRAISI